MYNNIFVIYNIYDGGMGKHYVNDEHQLKSQLA